LTVERRCDDRLAASSQQGREKPELEPGPSSGRKLGQAIDSHEGAANDALRGGLSRYGRNVVNHDLARQ
jgi:hypothetical protein